MTTIRPATVDQITVLEDSRRWQSIELRSDDIIISTPPKCGTTWTQGIVGSLLWSGRDLPENIGQVSPWIDMRAGQIEELAQRVGAQEHRRFLKTHSGADALAIDSDVTYVVVYRDVRDALVSWANHRGGMHPEIVEGCNALSAVDGVEPWPPRWSGDFDDLLDEWEPGHSPARHLASWWPLRHEPNVVFVHYNDLKADLDGEMRRLAASLSIDVAEADWPEAIDRCRLDRMRESVAAAGGLDFLFDGGVDRFFYKGTNGRWADLLSDAQVERCAALTAALPDDAAAWLEHGSLALGRRLDEPTGH
jgi:aryl sulfotransferase